MAKTRATMTGSAPVEADPWAAIRTLNLQKQADTEATGLGESGNETQIVRGGWATDFEALRGAGYQSKYNNIEDLGDGRLAVTLQRPGAHKYDTIKAIYAQDPTSGQWTLQNEPEATRSGGGGFSLDPRKQVRNDLLNVGVSDRIATGLTRGPTSSAALMVNDIARGVKSAGLDKGAVGTINREVMRNSEKDIKHEERGAVRAAAIAGAAYGGTYAAGAGGTTGATASTTAPVWNAALAESAVGTGGYGASSAGLGGGAAASWGAGAGYTADAASGASLADASVADPWAQTLADGTPTNVTNATGAESTNTLSNSSLTTQGTGQQTGLTASGQVSEPTLANVADASGTTVNAGNGSFQQFLQGGGQAKDYIQLGGLVASVAARPKAADTSGINDAARANAGIAERQQTLAEKQYADQLALFNEYKPMLTQQLQNTIAEQAKSTARSDQQWDNYTKTWLPIEQTLAQKSTDWASPGRMQQAAQEAQAGVATQYDTARQQSREQMIAAGLDPSTIATIQASTGALEAKDRAGAANTARRTVEQQGMAYLDNAARFGRNMTSTGLAAAGLAGQQGSQATNNYASLANASAAPAASANPLFNSAVGSNSSAGGLYGNAANINNQQSLQNYNQMMGTIAGVNQWYQSSKKTKKVHGKVKGAAAAVEKSGASRWSYKEGMGDGSTKERMGPMAEDLSRVAPSVSNGKVVDAIAMSGLHHAAIGENTRALREQNKRLKRIEKNLSLADA